MNESSRQDAASVTAISKHGERLGITASLENVSEWNNTLHVFNANVETRGNIPIEVSDLSVPWTRCDRQPYTHHIRRNSRSNSFQHPRDFVGQTEKLCSSNELHSRKEKTPLTVETGHNKFTRGPEVGEFPASWCKITNFFLERYSVREPWKRH